MAKSDQRSERAEAYRKLYRDPRWRGPNGRRVVQLAAEPWCRTCAELGKKTPATIVDHIRPHRGDPVRFFAGKLQSLCKLCHDSRKQRFERSGQRGHCDANGMPVDPAHPWNKEG